ncbi:MAG: HD domain-containing protein, partial [Clostridia bacterium]|nr:HD domain-containing protein [Clostridia bacterium]
IEAIALGHDIGHTPFGHAGEKILSDIYYNHTGRYFNHNVHSVRVLDGIFRYNLSLQTLDGILCHNGELELEKYKPVKLDNFTEFDAIVANCYKTNSSNHLIPSTLEGCVVRISDIIAYLGKDRQDAEKAGIIEDNNIFDDNAIGSFNAKIINNLIVNIVENSYGKDYISMDKEYYEALKLGKRQNYEFIYETEYIKSIKYVIEPMFKKIYEKCLNDILIEDYNSAVYKHHIDYVKKHNKYYKGPEYEKEDKNQIVVDYIASMTDDYMTELYSYLFPEEEGIKYVSYFHDL